MFWSAAEAELVHWISAFHSPAAGRKSSCCLAAAHSPPPPQPPIYMLLLAAGRPFDVMVSKPNVDCSVDAASGEMHITQVLQVCMASQCLT